MKNETDKNALQTVLAAILARAEDQGIQAAQLAKRAHVRPETLSRMKSRGTGDFGTIDAMARIVGLKLILVPNDQAQEDIQLGNFFR